MFKKFEGGQIKWPLCQRAKGLNFIQISTDILITSNVDNLWFICYIEFVLRRNVGQDYIIMSLDLQGTYP